MGARAVIITGGHAPGTTEYAQLTDVVDLLVEERTVHEFRTARVESRPTHGTGCAFASAVTAGLALGFALTDAARDAQEYVAGAIRHGLAIGHGRTVLDHCWNRRR